jgi:hypothetical protein
METFLENDPLAKEKILDMKEDGWHLQLDLIPPQKGQLSDQIIETIKSGG